MCVVCLLQSCFRLLDHFVVNMIPLDVVESESFRDLIKYCAPSAKDISRKALTRRIYNKYAFIAASFKCSYLLVKNLHLPDTHCVTWGCFLKSVEGYKIT